MTRVTSADVDATDPAVVLVTMLLTWAVSKLSEGWRARVSPYLPLIAVGFALFSRAVADTLQGQELTLETAARGLAAGGVAVLSHQQFRQFQKMPPKPPKVRDWKPPTPPAH